MAKVLKSVNRRAELEEFLRKIMIEDRDFYEYALWYVDFLLEDFRFNDALEILENNIERFNEETIEEYELRKIRINIELKKYSETEIIIMDKISEKSPDYRYYVYAAYLYLKINDYGLCEKYLSASLATGKVADDWLYNYIKGFMLLYRYKLAESIEHLERSLFLNPDFPYTRYYIADIFIRKRMFFRASRELKIIMDYWDDFEYIEDVYRKFRELK
jgi:tetratricopeptide (TPR) repeat protein